MGDPSHYTLPIVLKRYVDNYGADWGSFRQHHCVFLSCCFALQWHFVEGLTAGSVKG